MSLILYVIITAVVYSSAMLAIQRKLGNPRRLKEIQQEMKAKMAEMKKLGENTDSSVMNAKQKELSDLSMESLRHSFKPIIVVTPISLIVLYLAIPYVFGTQAINLSVMGLFTITTYRWLFIIAAAIFSLASSMVMNALDARDAKKKVSQEIAEAKAHHTELPYPKIPKA